MWPVDLKNANVSCLCPIFIRLSKIRNDHVACRYNLNAPAVSLEVFMSHDEF